MYFQPLYESPILASGNHTLTVEVTGTYNPAATASDGEILIDAFSYLTQSTPDTDPPTPNPATFASAPAALSDSEITMTATTGSDASGPVEYYFAETSGNTGGSDSGWQTSASYTDTGLLASTQYTYTVQMRDSLGNTGTASAPASATTQTQTPPDAPTGLAGTAGDGSVSLDWADNTEPDLASYTVYRSTTSGSGYSSIATGVSSSDYVDNTVTNGTTYYYVVTAVDTSSNESPYSNEASATPQAGVEPDMYVADITMGSLRSGRRYYGQATVMIKDDTGAAVEGATVYGTWSGAVNESHSGVTGSDGTVLLQTAGRVKSGTFTFTVTDVVKSGYVYNSALNVETSDSISTP